jgi:3-methyladenine DNA glycosylase AlkD
MYDIFTLVKKDLQKNIDKEYKKGCEKYFKEKIIVYGVRTPTTRKIAKKYYPYVKDLDKIQFLKICEIFFNKRYNEYATIATQWLRQNNDILNQKDVVYLKKIINKHLDNWAKIDDFCTHVVNPLIQRYPNLQKNIITWTSSKNKWLRRASAVSLITRNKDFYNTNTLKQVFKTSKLLLEDKEDLVQKGYGWLLKVTSDFKQKEVFEFVITHKKKMPRTALRYAIEKMPLNLKKKAMQKTIC